MTEKEKFEKNVTLSTEFSRYIIEHPEVAEKIPKGALVILLPQDDPKICEENRRQADKYRKKDQPMVFVKIEKLAPPRTSRLVNPVLELAH